MVTVDMSECCCEQNGLRVSHTRINSSQRDVGDETSSDVIEVVIVFSEVVCFLCCVLCLFLLLICLFYCLHFWLLSTAKQQTLQFTPVVMWLLW